ncbi:MAG: pimeloyl-ACP methyl ester carboxylesterase [Planctomycetota bacterium]|jgi:pimeloyl-ACP methyl ester carboxylesterase
MLVSRLKNFALILALLSVSQIVIAQDSRPNKAKKTAAMKVTKKEISFKSLDGLQLTADLYAGNLLNENSPFILLCHQAGWSRGEYVAIAPKLVAMGFNCLALDQRSGGGINDVANKSVAAAKKKGLPTLYLDARQDIIAALQFVKKKHAKGKLIVWGSSYSSALVLEIVGNKPDLADGVLSFAPGEYFSRFGKTDHFVRDGAKKLKVPVFLTGSKSETAGSVKMIADSMKLGKKLHFFKPKSRGNHGSRALWKKFGDSQDYWNAVTKFLDTHFPRQSATSKPSKKMKK